MEIKKVESVVMTGAELAKIVSYYVRDHYKKDVEFKWISLNGYMSYLHNDYNLTVEFKSEPGISTTEGRSV